MKRVGPPAAPLSSLPPSLPRYSATTAATSSAGMQAAVEPRVTIVRRADRGRTYGWADVQVLQRGRRASGESSGEGSVQPCRRRVAAAALVRESGRVCRSGRHLPPEAAPHLGEEGG